MTYFYRFIALHRNVIRKKIKEGKIFSRKNVFNIWLTESNNIFRYRLQLSITVSFTSLLMLAKQAVVFAVQFFNQCEFISVDVVLQKSF
jgi:hypothetical protein